MFETAAHAFYVFFIATLPILELRASIPIGYGLGMPWLETYLISVAGNMLPVPFILLFIRTLLKWMKKNVRLSKIAFWIERVAHNKSERVLKYASFGLFLFVAVPLPGTGAWTGALIAAMLDMRMKFALPSILAGVLAAGFIVSGICYGFFGAMNFLL